MEPRMTLAEARAVLGGDVSATVAEQGYAAGIVLARLDEMERRARQAHVVFALYGRAAEVAQWILTGSTEGA